MSEELHINYFDLENLASNLMIAADEFSTLSTRSSKVLTELASSIQRIEQNLDAIRTNGENVVSKIHAEVSNTVEQSWQGKRAEIFSSNDFPMIERNYASIEATLCETKEKMRFLLTEIEECILYLIHEMDSESDYCQNTSDYVKVYISEHKEADTATKIIS